MLAARCIVRLKAAVLDLISPDDNQRIEVERRALFLPDLIIPVRIECGCHAVRMLAVGRKRDDIRCYIEHQTRRGVEEFPSEIEDQGGEHEHASLLQRRIPGDVCKALIEE